MLWYYRCPKCGHEMNVDWPSRLERRTCRNCRVDHFPPAPAEAPEAYASGHKWPPELEQAVVTMNGKTCAVPGCYREYRKLAHRRPVSVGGRTSVANLVPLCAEHYEAKGQRNWEDWLATLEVLERRDEAARLEQPKDLPAAGLPDCSSRFPADARCRPLAGWVRVPDDTPPGMRLLAARPFVCGHVRKLILHYGWRRQSDGESEVALLAWPGASSPDLGHLNGTSHAERRHAGHAGETGIGWLEIELPESPGDCWVAAVALTDRAGRLDMDQCLLAEVE